MMMKIRTDFVTNSSSSSFTILIDVILKNGTMIQFGGPDISELSEDDMEDYYTYMEDGANEDFAEDPSAVLEADSINSLCEILNSIVTLGYFEEGENDEFFRNAQFKNFLEKLRDIGSVDEIKMIKFQREYFAWGEFSECTILNDDTLQTLASAVLKDPSEANRKALEDYMENADNALGFSFGMMTKRFVYKPDTSDLETIAKKISGSNGTEEGVEVYTVDFENKTSDSYAALNVQ